MGSGSQIIGPAEEQWADKSEPVAYEPERLRDFDEQEVGEAAGRSGVVDEERPLEVIRRLQGYI